MTAGCKRRKRLKLAPKLPTSKEWRISLLQEQHSLFHFDYKKLESFQTGFPVEYSDLEELFSIDFFFFLMILKVERKKLDSLAYTRREPVSSSTALIIAAGRTHKNESNSGGTQKERNEDFQIQFSNFLLGHPKENPPPQPPP